MYQSLSTALKCLNENQESMIKWINYLITQNRFFLHIYNAHALNHCIDLCIRMFLLILMTVKILNDLVNKK